MDTNFLCEMFWHLFKLQTRRRLSSHQAERQCMKEGEFKQSAVIRVTDRASDRSQKKKSNFVGFLGTNSWQNRPISLEFSGANFTEEQSVKKRRILRVIFGANFSSNRSVLR